MNESVAPLCDADRILRLLPDPADFKISIRSSMRLLMDVHDSGVIGHRYIMRQDHVLNSSDKCPSEWESYIPLLIKGIFPFFFITPWTSWINESSA